MNREVKAMWVEALRSGEYKQTTGRLHRGDAYCCYGVLCDLHAKAGLGQWDRGYYDAGNGAHRALPPREVTAWAGLGHNMPEINGEGLALRNDNGATFRQIADLIEKHL